MARLFLCISFSLLACGDDAVAGSTFDVGVSDFDVGAPVMGPDGASGVCCPLTIGIGCTSGSGYVGGWAASVEECVYDSGCCDIYYDDTGGAYGCPTRGQAREDSFCLGQSDAGPDTN